jgi:tripartite-type tricarboxylate transporter receptor subunit TctC
MKRRAVLAALLATLWVTPLLAQDAKSDLAKLKPKDFPAQPIEYTVVYPAGGALDVSARLLAKYVEKWTGDKIIVNNRTGGAGMVGHAYLATQAKPDGYSAGVIANLVWGDAMLRSQGRWSYTNLEPVGYINSDPLIWITSNEGDYKGKSLKEILQIAKDKPGTVRVATVPGSMWDYLIEQVEAESGAKFLKVPFQSGGAGVTALIGRNVDIAQGFYAEFRGFLDAGKVTPLAVAANDRLPHLPSVDTFNDLLGGKDYVWTLVRFVVVPKGTPADRKAYLAAGVRAAMQDPELISEYKKVGAYFDPTLTAATDVTAALNAYAEKEREFYIKTGRLKP